MLTDAQKEDLVIDKMIGHLLANDCMISVYYGEGDYGIKDSRSKNDIIKAMKACDEEQLILKTRLDGNVIGRLFLIYNNGEVSPISDMSAPTTEKLDKLAELMEPIDDYAESLED